MKITRTKALGATTRRAVPRGCKRHRREWIPVLARAVALGVWGVSQTASAESVVPPAPTAAPASESGAVTQASGDARGPSAGKATTANPTDYASQAPLVGNAAVGLGKAAVCAGCHGPDGNAPNPAWPKLAGQHPDYIAKQLKDFRAGRRSDPVMSAMAAALSDQDIADVAAHFSGQELRAGPSDSKLAAQGEMLYRNGRSSEGLFPCIGCHGAVGEGAGGAIDGGFPAVAGQNPAYLAKQLEGFRAGVRENDWKSVMQMVAARLSDEDIAALTAYLSSIHPSRHPSR